MFLYVLTLFVFLSVFLKWRCINVHLDHSLDFASYEIVSILLLQNQLASDCYSGLPLRNAVPDVAMATATLNHLTVQDSNIARSDLELDLGDGANHAGYGTVYI